MWGRVIQECRHGALAAAIFVAFVAPSSLTAQAGGTISGVVTTAARAPQAVRVTMDQNVCGNELPDEAVVVDGSGHLANAVVTVTGVKSKTAPSATGVMNEKCRFSPRVQIVRPNATITTSSKDPILHTTNLTTDAGKPIFNVAVPVPGIKIPRPLNTPPGLVRIVCNIHPWMRGYIMVTDELAAVSGGDGAFTLTDVPPGTYELRIWHESLTGAPQKVTVTAGQTTRVDIKLK
jgi:hypothetical protein